MDRHFDRDTYLNKEKYEEARKEEELRKQKLISERVECIREIRKYNEIQWRHFRNFIKMEIKVAIAENNGATDEGLEMMRGLSEEFLNKFLVAQGVRNPPGVSDETTAMTNLKSEGLI